MERRRTHGPTTRKTESPSPRHLPRRVPRRVLSGLRRLDCPEKPDSLTESSPLCPTARYPDSDRIKDPEADTEFSHVGLQWSHRHSNHAPPAREHPAITTDTTPRTPLDGLISCGSCGAPMREATGDHEALYVCHQEHLTGTEVMLQAHTTDRLVISGVLTAVLTEKSVATVQSAIREHEEQEDTDSSFPAEDISSLREDLSLFLRAAGRTEKTGSFLPMFITRIKLLPGLGGCPLRHAPPGRQPPGRGNRTGDQPHGLSGVRQHAIRATAHHRVGSARSFPGATGRRG